MERITILSALCLSAMLPFLGGCSRKGEPCDVVQVRPLTYYHKVQEGENLSDIAKRYTMTVEELCRLNALTPQMILIPGQKIFIVPQRSVVVQAPNAPTISVETHTEPDNNNVFAPVPGDSEPELEPEKKVADALPSECLDPMTERGFMWPVEGKLLRRFNDALPNGARSEGINISAAAGTIVKACDNGIVMDAGELVLGFGRMILLKHDNGMISIYGHLQEILVRKPQENEQVAVQKGQVIARVGKSGNVRTPQLHFQLRNRNKKPVDPLFYLKKSKAAQMEDE